MVCGWFAAKQTLRRGADEMVCRMNSQTTAAALATKIETKAPVVQATPIVIGPVVRELPAPEK